MRLLRILALETSGAGGSAAIADGPRLLAESQLPGQRRSTQTLAPTIKSLLLRAEWRPADVQLVAVTIGPGSFTGLRLGVATAKMFAYVTGAAVLGVETLRIIASQAAAECHEVMALLDAGRGELLSGHFRFATGVDAEVVSPTRLVRVSDWLAEFSFDTPITGPGSRLLIDRLPAGATTLPEALWEPRAATVARLAWSDYSAGRRDDLWSLAPIYYRRSAAEEVWEKKQR